MKPLARDSLFLITSNVFGAGLGFALSLVVSRGLGVAGFGRWTFCLTWAAALTMLCELGLNSLLTREASRAPADSNKFLGASLVVKLILVSILGAVVWFLAPILSLDVETSNALRVAMLIAVAGIAYSPFAAVFRSFGWMSAILGLNVTGLAAQLIWSIWLLRSGGGVLDLMWVAAAVDAAQLLAAVGLWWMRIMRRGGAFQVSVGSALHITKQAIPFAIAGALDAVQLRSSVMMIGYLRGVSEVGWFGAAARFSEAAKLVPYGILGALYPAFATPQGAIHFYNFRRVIQGLALGVTLVLCLFARPILALSFGPDFLPAVPVLFYLGAGLLPSLLNGYVESYLYAAGDEKYATQLRALAAVVQVSSGLVLVHFFGASGAAISLALGEIAIWLPLQRRIKMILP